MNYEEIEKITSKLKKDDGFECEECGKCCYSPKNELNYFDIERFEENNVDLSGVDFDKFIPTIIEKEDGSCYYLDRKKKLCTIHLYKPSICRNYPFFTYDGWIQRKPCLKEQETQEFYSIELYWVDKCYNW